MKYFLSALTIIVMGSTAAQAQNLTVNEPAAKPNCKMVEIARPNVTAPLIQIRFGRPDVALKSDMAAMIKECNEGVAGTDFVEARSFQGRGAEVRMRSTVGAVGVAKIALPLAMTDSTADQVVCIANPGAGAARHNKYMAQWSNEIPSSIKLEVMVTYDKEAADRGCEAARTARK